MMINNVTIGSDPELFLELDGEIISAEGLIGGTKDDPIPISEEGHAIQEDNVLVEFNTPPARSKGEFLSHVNYCIDYIEMMLRAKPGMKLEYSASHDIDPKFLQSDQAKEFSCEPDYNVYLRGMNPRVNSEGVTLRSAGGHIHIGYNNPNMKTSVEIIHMMDAVLGLKSVMLDDDTRRRQLYGSAGSYRPKSYGVEYRTLSNFWLKTDELIEWAYESTLQAVELVNSGVSERIIEELGLQIEDTINSGNKDRAESLMETVEAIILTQKQL